MGFQEIKSSVAGFIREKDMFGHTITFNFDRKGDTHNTIVGGSFSIFIRLFLILYTGICFKRLIWQERDSLNTTLLLNDIKKVGAVDYLDTNMTVYWVLRKQDKTAQPPALKKDLHEYIDVYFM